MPNLATLTARYARRPLLLEPNAARGLLTRLERGDPRGLRSESRFEAALRKIGLRGGREIRADFDDEHYGVPVPEGPTAYAPLWAQQAFGEPVDEGIGWTLYEGVAILRVDTPLAAEGENFCGAWFHGYDTIQAALVECDADERVRAVLLIADSPGGVVSDGLYALADFMRDWRGQGGKPIHVHAQMACSAMYWVAAQSSRISCGPSAWVGSIGAVVVHEDWSEADRQAGLVVSSIQFGANKTLGADWKALSDEDRARLQADIDDIGADFVAAVEAGRPQLTSAALIATQADVYKGQHRNPELSAEALGFVDAVCTERAAFEALLAELEAPATTTQPAAPREGAPDPDEEEPVRLQAKGGAGKAPAAKSGRTAPEASTASEKVQRIKQVVDGEGDDETKLDQVEQITEEETDPPHEDEQGGGETPPANPAPLDGPGANAAAAIAASAEAKSNPTMALAAIQSGSPLAAFRAMARAVGPEKTGGRLAQAMAATGAGQPLGPDSKAAGGARMAGSALRERAAARRADNDSEARA